MLHLWTKQRGSGRARGTVAVIDNDDELRRTALRALRRLDVKGVGLLDTSAAMRWLAVAQPAVAIVDAARVADAARAVAHVPVDERPALVALSPSLRAEPPAGAAATLLKPLDADELCDTVMRLLAARGLAEVPTESVIDDGREVGIAAAGAAQPSARKRNKRVLLVDDDEDIRETFSILLEEEGYDVVPAPHGKAAWNALEGGLRPDVILLDLMMPFMNGQEVFARLRSSPQHQATPVVVITAGQPVALGDAPVLRKPVDMRDLLRIVESAAM